MSPKRLNIYRPLQEGAETAQFEPDSLCPCYVAGCLETVWRHTAKIPAWEPLPCLIFHFLHAHNFPLKACLASEAAYSLTLPLWKTTRGEAAWCQEQCQRCSTLTFQIRLPVLEEGRKHAFIPPPACLDTKFYLQPKQSQIAYWETFPHVSNRSPWSPPTSLAWNKYLQIPNSSWNIMGNLSVFH